MEKDRKKNIYFFSPTQLPEDEISNMVSLLQRDIIIWFWCIFPTKGNAACPRKHIYLEFLKDTELRQMQNKGFRWQTWDISWWAEWQVKSSQIYLSIYHLLRTYDMPRAYRSLSHLIITTSLRSWDPGKSLVQGHKATQLATQFARLNLGFQI